MAKINLLESQQVFEIKGSGSSLFTHNSVQAPTEMHTASLIALGLVLFFITLIVLIIAKLLLLQLVKREGRAS